MQSKDRYAKYILLVFVLLVVVKSLISVTIAAPSIWSDEYSYVKLAQGIFTEHRPTISGVFTDTLPPLYPLVISPAYIFKDMSATYAAMKIINSIISSLILFPAFLLASEFLSRKRAFLCALLISVIPANFSFSNYIMAENLFYPLVLFTIYFLYKSHEKNSGLFSALAGIAAGLAILTKSLGFLLLVIFTIVALIQAIRNKAIFQEAGNLFLKLFSAALVIAPWFLVKGAKYGYTAQGIVGKSYFSVLTAPFRHELFWPSFINWLFLYAGFIVLASGIVFAVYAVSSYREQDKNFRTFFIIAAITILSFIVLLADNAAGGKSPFQSPFWFFTERPIGRYVDAVLPLVFILGFKGIELQKKAQQSLAKICTAASVLLAISAQLSIASLFPGNNMSLTHIGIFKQALSFLFFRNAFDAAFHWPVFIAVATTLLLLPILLLPVLKKISFKKLFVATAAFFMVLSLTNAAITVHEAQKWNSGGQMQLGIWMKNNIKADAVVWFDTKYSGNILDGNSIVQQARAGYFTTVAGFWLQNKIAAGEVKDAPQGAYVITRSELTEMQIVKSLGNLHVYKK